MWWYADFPAATGKLAPTEGAPRSDDAGEEHLLARDLRDNGLTGPRFVLLAADETPDDGEAPAVRSVSAR